MRRRFIAELLAIARKDLRANALIYLVTVTPVILNVAIEKIPRIQKNNSDPLENAYEKYV